MSGNILDRESMPWDIVIATGHVLGTKVKQVVWPGEFPGTDELIMQGIRNHIWSLLDP